MKEQHRLQRKQQEPQGKPRVSKRPQEGQRREWLQEEQLQLIEPQLEELQTEEQQEPPQQQQHLW